MEKFSKTMLILCFIVLIITAIEVNQIRVQTETVNQESLIERFRHHEPIEIESNQKTICENFAEFTIKDKNFTNKIDAPVNKMTFNYYGESFIHTNYIAVQDDKNRFAYVSLNVKNLYKKVQNINDLIDAKIIFDNNYEFDCFAIKTTKDQTDFTKNIALMPLQSDNLYLVAEMPRDFVNSSKPMTLELTINKQKYVMKLR